MSATSAKKAKTTNSFYKGILVRDKGLKHMRKTRNENLDFLGPEMAKNELLRESVWRKYAERRDGTLVFRQIKPFFFMGRGLLCTPPPPGHRLFDHKILPI
jgi:hypothetical protein